MPSATQTFVTGGSGTNWGYNLEDSSAGPSYTFVPVSIGGNPLAAWFGAAAKWRGYWELDMATLVSAGYTPGTALTSATLSLTITTNSAAVKMGVVGTNIAAGATTAWTFMDDGTDLPAFSGTGAKTYTMGASSLAAIQALNGTDKRLIAMYLSNEAAGGQMNISNATACVLTLTWTDPSPRVGSMGLLGVGK